MFLNIPKHLVWILNWTRAGCSSRQSSCLRAGRLLGPAACSVRARSLESWLFCCCFNGKVGVCGGGGLSQQQLSSCPLLLPQQQEQQTLLFSALSPLPSSPAFTSTSLSRQERPVRGIASSMGWQHSLSSVWQRTLYLTHHFIMMSCLSKFILPFHMDRNVLFHVLLSPSVVE